tara:strand:- start:2041 stop:2487 length:447 start_codon:yes stop_codon:yes gene_type:complete
MLDKATICKAIRSELNEKGKLIQLAFDDLNSAITDDSKSTAGDKHETGRAMVHLEQEKLSKQLIQNKHLQQALQKIDPDKKSNKVQFGSLVSTDRGVYFFSIGLGKITVDGYDIFCLTPITPLGQKLFDCKKGDSIEFNGVLEILEVQ